jgi:hypothetical protein
MPTGYCSVEDVRHALQEAEFTGAAAEADNAIVVKAIASQTEPLEKELKRHWYEPSGVENDPQGLIPIAPKSRDDEEDIPTGGAHLVGEPVTPKTYQQGYTKIRLARRDAKSVSQLLVATADGYEDWVASNEYDGGSFPAALGDDYYLRENNGGWSELYLNADHFLDEDGEPLVDSFANAVYVFFEYGHEGLPDNVRRAVAMRAAAQLLAPDDDAALGIPDNGNLVAQESKVKALERQADELLEVYR